MRISEHAEEFGEIQEPLQMYPESAWEEEFWAWLEMIARAEFDQEEPPTAAKES
jgi:hypothetical protein